MNFTINDIRDNNTLRNFIRMRVTTAKAKIQGKCLVNIYDTQEVIKVIREKIKQHSKGTNSTKYIPTWKLHIESLQKLEKKLKEEQCQD